MYYERQLRGATELSYICDHIDEYEAIWAEIIFGYIELARHFSELTEQEVSLFAVALAEYKKTQDNNNSASGNTLPSFWQMIVDHETTTLELFFEYVSSVLSAKNVDLFSSQLEKTIKMMVSASKINQRSIDEEGNPYPFVDGDPVSDDVRWTFTQIVIDPGANPHVANLVYLHYLASHFMDQVVMSWIQEVFSEAELLAQNLDLHKDGFLAVMTDLLTLDHIKGSETTQTTEIRGHWVRPRSEGGLGWLKQLQIDVSERILLSQ